MRKECGKLSERLGRIEFAIADEKFLKNTTPKQVLIEATSIFKVKDFSRILDGLGESVQKLQQHLHALEKTKEE